MCLPNFFFLVFFHSLNFGSLEYFSKGESEWDREGEVTQLLELMTPEKVTTRTRFEKVLYISLYKFLLLQIVWYQVPLIDLY